MLATLEPQNPHLSSTFSFAGCKMEDLNLGPKTHHLSYRSRTRTRTRQPACTCANRPGSARCARHGYVVPEKRLKRRPGRQEILQRALTPPPPPRPLALRWLNFRPTPSRLSVMSTA